MFENLFFGRAPVEKSVATTGSNRAKRDDQSTVHQTPPDDSEYKDPRMLMQALNLRPMFDLLFASRHLWRRF